MRLGAAFVWVEFALLVYLGIACGTTNAGAAEHAAPPAAHVDTTTVGVEKEVLDRIAPVEASDDHRPGPPNPTAIGETHYYLIARDGTKCRVSERQWFIHGGIGSTYRCQNWQPLSDTP